MAESRPRETAIAPRAETGVVPSDPLSRYLAEASRYPLLSREDEQALAVRVHEHGDREAAERLALSNLRLVVKIAMEYRRVWTNVLDLIQEGNVGLLQGVRRFDPYRGVKLSSYAAYWIRAYILKYLIDNIRLVRMGSSRAERKLFFQLNRAKRELERAGLDPEPKLLAERLEVEERDVVDMERRLAGPELSLDAPVGQDESGSPLGELLEGTPATAEAEVGDGQVRAAFRAHVAEFANGLEEREQRILRERILSEEPKTLQALGDEFGLTRERVRQLEAKLVARLREHLREKLVDFDYWAPET
jgi:RNA polymerase sigma-32 factor